MRQGFVIFADVPCSLCDGKEPTLEVWLEHPPRAVFFCPSCVREMMSHHDDYRRAQRAISLRVTTKGAGVRATPRLRLVRGGKQ